MTMAESVMTVLMSVTMGDENWEEEMFEVPLSFFCMEESPRMARMFLNKGIMGIFP